MGYFRLRLQRIVCTTFPVDDTYFIGIMAKTGSSIIQRIEHNKVEVFAFELSFGILLLIIGFERKANQALLFSFYGS